MAVDLSRRNLLRGRRMGERPVRPPWAVNESLFTDRCTSCGDCEAACPEKIIRQGSAGYPEVDFRRGECTFCESCVNACETGALVADVTPPWNLELIIGDRCLASRGVICQTCGDVCARRAIRFRPQLGKVATPEVDPMACNGCGECVASCPEDVIRLQPVVQERT